MASAYCVLKDELSCPVCLGPFTDAVTLQCGHNFCRVCVTRSWAQKAGKACPVCNNVQPREELSTNHTLNNLVEVVRSEKLAKESEGLCPRHMEGYKLFCLADKEVICSQCLISKQHKGHRVRPVPETANDYRAKLKNMEASLQESLKTLKKFMRTYDSVMENNVSETTRIKQKIKKDFEKLHEFLREEEKVALSNLEQDVQQKQKLINEQIKKAKEDLTSLTTQIARIKSEMEEDDLSFLIKHKNRKRRIACTVEVPNTIPAGLLIDVARHLGSLQSKVWKKMLNIIEVVPFSFDLNTAGPGLEVSNALNSVTSVSYSSSLHTADHFSIHSCILGSTAFSKGQHSWEVDLEGNMDWRVGVVKQSIERNSFIDHEAKNGFWFLYHNDYDKSTEYRVSSCCLSSVNPGIELKRIRVDLDYEEGELSFYDGECKTHLFTFHEKFSGDLIPYFFVQEVNPSKPPKWMTICPLTICILEDAV